MSLHVISINTRGLASQKKRREFFYWVYQKQGDIIFLQETHSVFDNEIIWRSEWGGNVVFSHGNSDSRGTAILFKNSFGGSIVRTEVDEYGRYIYCLVKKDDIEYLLINVYGPNTDEPEFFKTIFDRVSEFNFDYIILGGDINLVIDPTLDRKTEKSSKESHLKSRSLIKQLMEEYDMVDIWRLMHANERKYTWSRKNPVPTFSRLDMFLISYGLANQIDKSYIKPGYKTDHSLIGMNISIGAHIRGPGFWKLNCKHLMDPHYITVIRECISNTAEVNKDLNAQMLWEMIKLNIRGESIKYSTQKKKSVKNMIACLEHKISKIETIDIMNVSDMDIRKQELMGELQKLIEDNSKGAMIRAKLRWYEDGEKPTKYFLNLEKRNYNSKAINRIQLANGDYITDFLEIQREQNSFFSQLYTTSLQEDIDIENHEMFQEIDHPTLSEDEKQSCEGEITEGELYEALKTCNKNRSPGNDGLPAEFYDTFWVDIKKHLVNSINMGYNKGELSTTQKQGIITLIPKKDKSNVLLKNWRPLTLLNQDYKLATKVIASRIKKVLEKIVHHDQTGFIKNRYIGENIARILDIMNYTEEEDIPAILVMIDFEKAFDCVEWACIERSLKFFNFGDSLCRWFKVFYNKISSFILNKGYTGDPVNPSRGMRQGCPLSPYLFIIVAEILGLHVRKNPHIKGIKIGDTEHKIAQFADDTTLILLAEEQCFREAMTTFSKFQDVSGLAINYNKTEVLRIGALKGKEIQLHPEIVVKWTNDTVNSLGIKINPDTEKMLSENYSPIKEKIANLVKIWNRRKLTIMGRSVVIKSLLTSQLTYVMSILPTPSNKFIKEINQSILNYLWEDKPPRISKVVMWGSKESGGLKIPNMYYQDKALKLNWVKRYKSSNNLPCLYYLNKIYPCASELIWDCNLHENDIGVLFKDSAFVPKVLEQVLKYWCQLHFHGKVYTCDKTQIENQILWLNSNIKVGNQVIFYTDWYRKGVKYVKDILHDDTRCLTYAEFSNKFQINCNFLKYFGIVAAVQKVLNFEVATENCILLHNEDFDRMVKVCRGTYELFIKNTTDCPLNSMQKWCTDLGMELNFSEWDKYFINIYKTTIVVKLRTLQFNILHRTLVTNHILKIWKKVDSNLCTFCKTEDETIFHLIFQCSEVQQFWHRIQVWYHSKGLDANFNSFNCVIGPVGNKYKLFNTVCILAKQHIYYSRCMNIQLNFQMFLKLVEDTQKIEYFIAKKNDKVRLHIKKWEPMLY